MIYVYTYIIYPYGSHGSKDCLGRHDLGLGPAGHRLQLPPCGPWRGAGEVVGAEIA